MHLSAWHLLEAKKLPSDADESEYSIQSHRVLAMCVCCFVHKCKEYIMGTYLHQMGHCRMYTGTIHFRWQLHDHLQEEYLQKQPFQFDFRANNQTSTVYIQLNLYWHPVTFKIRVLLGFLFYTSSGIQLQGAYLHGINWLWIC